MEINNIMKTTAILPIFNEEKTVAKVLSVLLKSKLLNEVVVVDDASTDNSLNIIKNFKSSKLKIIHLEKNLGKSGAVKIAVKKTKSDILFFCDGDLHNFKLKHVKKLLKPLQKDKYSMIVGIRDRGIIHNTFVKNFGPLITGERAVSKKIFEKVAEHPLMKDYAMEFVLNDYCVRNNIPIKRIILQGVKQTNKPYKYSNKLKGVMLLLKQIIALVLVYANLKCNLCKTENRDQK